MKNIVLLSFLFVAIIMGLSCQKQDITDFSTEYDLKQIQNDSNWIEIIDTIPINFRCSLWMGYNLNENNFGYEQKFVLMNNLKYQELLDPLNSNNCVDTNPPKIDFDAYSLIGYKIFTGKHYTENHLYENTKENKYLYFIIINNLMSTDSLITMDYRYSSNWYLVPKLNENYTFQFDTIIKYVIH